MASNVPSLDGKSRRLVSQIVEHFKRQGNFDELRRDCLDELDKMESFRQLNQRVESYVATFLSKQEWTDSLPKNQVRDSLRKHVNQSEALNTGVERLITQALERKRKSFQMRIEGVVQHYLYTEKQKEREARWKASGGQTPSYRLEPEKSAFTETKTCSTISNVSDIISQLPGMQDTSTKTETSTKGQSSLSSGQSKVDPTKQEKKEESSVSSGSEVPKSSGNNSKHSPGLVKSTKGKRIAHKISVTTSPNVGSPSEGKEKGGKHSETALKAKQQSIKGVTSTSSSESLAKRELLASSPASKVELPSPKVDDVKDDLVKSHSAKVKEDQGRPLTPKPKDDQMDLISSKGKDDQVRSSSTKDQVKSLPSKAKDDQSQIKSVPLQKEFSHLRAAEVKQSTAFPKSDPVDTVPERVTASVDASREREVVKEQKGKKPSLELPTAPRESVLKPSKGKEVQQQEEVKPIGDNISTKDTEMAPEQNPEGHQNKEESDVESDSDISDVSSVHTSDLSSFDGEVSSDSENESNLDEGGPSQEGERDSDNIVPRPIRSRRRKSRELEESEEEASEAAQHPKRAVKPRASADVSVKRRRGRPRKDEEQYKSSAEKKQQIRQARSRARQRKEAAETRESSDGNVIHMRHRSKRRIQRKRCYSPSSESTREVCLPSKRTRTGSKD